MSTSASLIPSPLPHHIAIIMDGNNRYGKAQGLERGAGPVSYTHLTLPTTILV